MVLKFILLVVESLQAETATWDKSIKNLQLAGQSPLMTRAVKNWDSHSTFVRHAKLALSKSQARTLICNVRSCPFMEAVQGSLYDTSTESRYEDGYCRVLPGDWLQECRKPAQDKCRAGGDGGIRGSFSWVIVFHKIDYTIFKISMSYHWIRWTNLCFVTSWSGTIR